MFSTGQDSFAIDRRDIDAAEALTPAIVIGDESDRCVVELHRKPTLVVGGEIELGDVGPALGQSFGIWALQLGGRNGRDAIGPNVGLPVLAGGMPRTTFGIGVGGCHLVGHLVELEE